MVIKEKIPEQLIIENFVKHLSVTLCPDLAIAGSENYAILADGASAKVAIARARLPNLFKDGFNAMDVVHLQQVRHRLDTAVSLLKNLKENGKGRQTIVLVDAWDPKMKVEEIKAGVDNVYSPGVPLECDEIWVAESHANPSRFVNVTPNRPKNIIPIKSASDHENHAGKCGC